MRSDRIRTPEPDTPSMIPRIVSAALVLVSIATVFAYPEISGRTLGLPERLNAGNLAPATASARIRRAGGGMAGDDRGHRLPGHRLTAPA